MRPAVGAMVMKVGLHSFAFLCFVVGRISPGRSAVACIFAGKDGSRERLAPPSRAGRMGSRVLRLHDWPIGSPDAVAPG